MNTQGEVHHLFVYGTLQPGEQRWPELARFVRGEGTPATVAGRVYDTGLSYPAAIFDEPSDSRPMAVIRGRLYELTTESLSEALAHLDHVEGAVRGLYRRIVVQTTTGQRAWAYQCGDVALLVNLLPSGDWLQRTGVE